MIPASGEVIYVEPLMDDDDDDADNDETKA